MSVAEVEEQHVEVVEALRAIMTARCDRPSAQVLLEAVVSAHRLVAWIEGASLRAHRGLVEQERERLRVEGLSRGQVRSEGQLLADAVSLMDDEVMVATGLGLSEVQRRGRVATAHPSIFVPLVRAMEAGTATLYRATSVRDDTYHLPDEAAAQVADRVLRPKRGYTTVDLSPSALVGHRLFRARLAAECTRATNAEEGAAAQRDRRHAQRDVHTCLDELGLGELTICGAADQVGAARDRLDRLARAAKATGDDRTLAQLRADLTWGLLMHGVLPETVAEGAASPHPAHPVAEVAIRIDLTTLLGLRDDPCQIPGIGWIPAEVARSIALRDTSVWHRVVHDPVSGALVERSTQTYRPTTALRRDVEARDLTCRAPGCDERATRCDLDHTVAWPTGQTRTGNLVALCRRHHERKTRQRWQHEQSPDGTVTFTTRLGQRVTTRPGGEV